MAAGLDAAQRPGSEVVDHALAWLREQVATSRSSRGCISTIRTARTCRPSRIDRAFRRRCRARTTGRSASRTRRSAGCSTLSPQPPPGQHRRCRRRRSRRVARRARRAAARLLRLRRGRRNSADRRRTGRPARAVADQVRIVDVMPTMLEAVGVAAPPAVQGVSLMPLARGERLDLLALQRDLVSALSLRLERADRGARRPLQVHRGAAPRALRHADRSRRAARPGGVESARGRRARARARRDDGEDWPRRRRRKRRGRSTRTWRNGCARSATSAAASAARTLDDRPRGDPKDKIGLYNLLKLAAQRLGGGPARRGDREGAAGARGRPRGDRGLHDARQHAHQGAPAATRRSPRTRRRWRSTSEHEGAAWSLALAYQAGRKLDEARGRLRARAAAEPAQHARPLYQLADICRCAAASLRGPPAALEEGADARTCDRAAFLVKLGRERGSN